MAARQLVLCEPLCFIMSKVNKIGKNVLTKYIIENMEAAAITAAKAQLVKDTEDLKLEKMPRVIGRYDVGKRAEKEVKDIFTLIDFLDQNKSLDKLPRYVTDDPDNLPSIRIFDGDLGFMMKRFDQMERKVEKLTSLMAAMNDKQTHLLDKEAWPALQQSTQLLPLVPPSIVNAQDDVQKPSYMVAAKGSYCMTSGKPPGLNAVSLQPGAEAAAAAATVLGSGAVINAVNQLTHDQLFHAPGTEWASITSTPDHHPLNYGSNDDEHEPNGDSRQFTTVQNKKKRRKPDMSDPRPAAGSNNRRRPLAVGHAPLRPSSPGHVSLSAAPRQTINREVFYVDNIGPSHSANDVHKFVTSLSVRVLSCFEVKPRKRRVDYMPDRKAFRLCILSEDRDKLFNENKWPMHVTLSDWFFKSRDSGTERNRLDSQSDSDSQLSSASSHDRPSRLSRGSSSSLSQQAEDVAAAFCAAAALVAAGDQQTLSDSTLKADDSQRSELCDVITTQSSTSSAAESTQNAAAADMTNFSASPDQEEFMDADATDRTQEAAVDNPTSDLLSHDDSYA